MTTDEVDENLWYLYDVNWESGPEAVRDVIAGLDRAELERLLALAVDAIGNGERRADAQAERIQRRLKKSAARRRGIDDPS